MFICFKKTKRIWTNRDVDFITKNSVVGRNARKKVLFGISINENILVLSGLKKMRQNEWRDHYNPITIIDKDF